MTATFERRRAPFSLKIGSDQLPLHLALGASRRFVVEMLGLLNARTEHGEAAGSDPKEHLTAVHARVLPRHDEDLHAALLLAVRTDDVRARTAFDRLPAPLGANRTCILTVS